MLGITTEKVAKYLSTRLERPVTVRTLTPLGGAGDVKEFGYGMPVRVDYESSAGNGIAVLHTLSPGPFGHEHMEDRARELLWEHRAFNQLPRHIRSLDVGAISTDGDLKPLGTVDEFFLLTEYAQGGEYAQDFERIRDQGCATVDDFTRADALCDYLAEIHQVRRDDLGLYARRIRELVGGHECIMGLADSYPADSVVSPAILEHIESQCVQWRWRLKNYAHRLRQVHGDFHPWNILFRSPTDFTLLDRSRGEFGDPADDVTCLTLNYVFFSLQRGGRLEGALEQLFRRFWDRYLDRTGDREILQIAAPFFAFRGLVMASPVWYPVLSDQVRRALVRFILAILNAESFDPALVNTYCGV